MADLPEPLRVEALGSIPHGFFGRKGGVSTGLAAGLQVGLGAGDDPAAVAANRARVVRAVLPGAALETPYQTHSSDALVVDDDWKTGVRPEGDALVTARRGVLLGVVTADCAPVLLADRQAGVVAAAHAGWRGAQGGILENTLAAMVRLGAVRADIHAAIGPTIAQASYEVDEAFRKHFGEADDRFFVSARPGRFMFDLPAYVASRLEAAGVGHIEDTSQDTYALSDRYFSYRRATHGGQATYCRQIAVIGLQETAPGV